MVNTYLVLFVFVFGFADAPWRVPTLSSFMGLRTRHAVSLLGCYSTYIFVIVIPPCPEIFRFLFSNGISLFVDILLKGEHGLFFEEKLSRYSFTPMPVGVGVNEVLCGLP